MRIAKTGRNFPEADPLWLAQLEGWADQAPSPRLLDLAQKASPRHGLTPPILESELGARCHVIAMTRMVDSLASLMCETQRREPDEMVA